MLPAISAYALGSILASCALVVLPDTKYPPSLTWRTIATEHFVVEFHQGEDALARRVADIAEDAHRRLVPILHWEPAAPTHLVLSDTSDDVSGAATPIPYNVMYINLTPPVGSMFLINYDDWLRLVITHEYAHILHLDTAGDVPGGLRRVFGRVPFVLFPFLSTIPNLWQPIWMVEGLATYEETELGASDRRDGAFADMILRMAVLENAFPTIDQADGLDRWPAGHTPYLFGARFYQYLASQFGDHVPAEISRLYAARPATFFVGATAQSLLGSGYAPIWERWRESLVVRFQTERDHISARGLTVGVALTDRGGMILGPAASPDGARIAYTEHNFETFPSLRIVQTDGAGDHELVVRNSGFHVSWSPDNSQLAFSQRETWKNYSTYDDLYLTDARTGRVRRLTSGARASDPDFSPDGKTLVFVGRELGRSRLATFDLATGAIRPLTEWNDAVQYATPRWSPDGARIAVTIRSNGRQDIALLDVHTQTLTPVTNDSALDLTPSWTRDGRTVYFTSDRTGVYNVFAYSLVDRTLFRATNVLGGAFTPTALPDGRIVFADYHARGFDLRIHAPTAIPASSTSPTPDRAQPPPVTPTVPSASRPYSPLPTLAPRFWAPVLSVDEEGGQYGVTTGGLDVLGYHKYALTALYGPSSGRGSYVLTYGYDRWYPSLTLSVSDVAALYGDFFQEPNGRTSEYWEQRQRLTADITLPILKTRWSAALSVGYRGERLSALRVTPIGAQAPAEGVMTGLRAAWRYTDAHEFGRSISPEGGRRLLAAFQRNDESWGGDFNTVRYLGAWYEYISLPHLPHHVLALRAVGGRSSGDILPQRMFQLGGVALSEEAVDGDGETVLLRGYRARAIRGQKVAVGSAEYRFPIRNIERGFTTKPFFFQRVHGAVFVDHGNAWDLRADASNYRTGVGAELGTDMTIGYRLRIRVRLGVAVGRSDDGVTQAYLSAGHAF
ncbi:MAG: BamA/TamA family outer membrane protein [Nitrospirota bacterium]